MRKIRGDAARVLTDTGQSPGRVWVPGRSWVALLAGRVRPASCSPAFLVRKSPLWVSFSLQKQERV